MQREVNIFLVHTIHQQSHCLGHQQRVGSFHRDHDIVESLLHGDAQVLHAGLHHPLGGIAISTHDPVGEGAVVHTDAYGGTMLLADIQEGYHLGSNLIHLPCILLFSVLQFGKGLLLVDEVPRVDAHLLGHRCRHQGSTGIEVDIGRKRGIIPLLTQLPVDVAQVIRFTDSLCGEPYQVGTGGYDPLALGYAALGIACIGVGHRLHNHRKVPPHGNAPHRYIDRGTTFVIEKIHSFPLFLQR